MREINKIIIHCAATTPSMDIGFKEINSWHQKKGYFCTLPDGKMIFCGYHYIIRRDGVVQIGRPLEKAGAHAVGHNTDSIGICLVGGLSEKNRPECNFTKDQWEQLNVLVGNLEKQFKGVKIIGHSEVANKACPCFDVQMWLKNGRGIAKENKI